MKNIETLAAQQKADRNPGHNIGTFLIEHSNSPEYLVSQLEAYLEAAKADLETERSLFRKLSGCHEHQWGPLERSRFAGTVHRKCTVPGCKAINALDDDEGDDE